MGSTAAEEKESSKRNSISTESKQNNRMENKEDLREMGRLRS